MGNAIEKIKTEAKKLLDLNPDSPSDPEKFDVKQALQDTKASLEKLRASVDEKKITDTDKPKTIKYLDECVTKIVTMEGITAEEKTMLEQIKTQIDAKNDVNDISIMDIINVVSALELKAEQLTSADQEKVKALDTINKTHKITLDGLKTDIQEKIKEKKQEFITKIKEDLEAHRWSKWLAQPAYDYLMKKYIDKEEIGGFEEFIMGTVGMAVVGRFVSKDLKEMIGKIDELKLSDFDVFDKAEKIKDAIKAKIKDPSNQENIKNSLEGPLFVSLKHLSGKEIDEVKYKEIFSAWFKKWGVYLEGDYEALMKKIDEKKDINLAANLFSLLSFPPMAAFDLIVRFADAGIFDWNDVIMNGVVKNTGKMILEFGIGSLGLFANAIKIPFGLISTEEFAKYAKDHISSLNVSSKMAFWGLLYRRGGWFWTLAGRIGQVAGEGIGLVLGSRTSGQVSALSAYRQGGVGGNTKKQIEIFKQLEKDMGATGMFKGKSINGLHDVFADMIKVVEKNQIIFHGASTCKTTAEFKSYLTKQGYQDVISDLNLNTTNMNAPLQDVKNSVGVLLKTNMQGVENRAKSSFGATEKLFSKLKLPWSKNFFEREVLEMLVKNAELQEKLLSNNEFFHSIKKFFIRSEMGKVLSNVVEHGDKIRFNLKDVDHAKDFFDNIGYIGRSSPEILKVLFKGFPLIMVGDTVLDGMKEGTPLFRSAVKGMAYITPFVGPLFLISEGTILKAGKEGKDGYRMNDIAGAGIGVGMLALDGFYFTRSTGGFWKFMASPILDAASFMKSMGKGTYGFLKMTRDGITVLRTGGAVSFGAEGLAFLKRAGISIAGIAILVYLGYLAWQEVFDGASDEEKEELKKLDGKTPGDIQAIITAEWKNLNDNQKSAVIKLATAQKLGFTNLENLDVEKVGDKISVSLNVLVSKDALRDVKSEVQDRVSEMEGGKKTTLDYELNTGEIVYILKRMKEQNGEFDPEKHLMALGYSEQVVANIIKHV